MTMHYEVDQFHRSCMRMRELVRSRLLETRELGYLDASLETVKVEIDMLMESLVRREQTMITDGTQRNRCALFGCRCGER